MGALASSRGPGRAAVLYVVATHTQVGRTENIEEIILPVDADLSEYFDEDDELVAIIPIKPEKEVQ
jgi:hypothetical protein